MKKLAWLLLTAMVLLFITACGTAETEENAADSNETNGSGEVVDENAEEEEVSEENGEEAEGADIEVIQAEGTYVGLADPHTIEIQTEAEAISLQILDPSVEDIDFEAIEPDTECQFEYYQNEHGQNILTHFDAKK